MEKKLALAVANTQTVLSCVNRKVNKILLKSFVLSHITNLVVNARAGVSEEETDEITVQVQIPDVSSQM